MNPGRIHTGDELTSDREVRCDVCVIGSGSGGAWLAQGLVERGLDVVMLEEGSYRTRREFDLTEGRAYPALYQELGNRMTDDLAISILQGRSVGGGTTVNWCSSFRTPDRILELWRRRYGVDGLTRDALTPHWEAIERRLHIAEWPLARINENNRVLWEGLGKLGYERGLIRRNVHHCANLGYCGLGCPIDAKQAMGATVIPDAVERGLTVYANASAQRLVTEGGKVTAVHARVLDPARDVPSGRTLTVKARVTAVCCGAINSPALLLRSGLSQGGRVGARTFLHPTVVMLGLFDREISPWEGAPQSVYSHHFSDRGADRLGFFLEVAPVHPMLASTVSTGMGAAHQALLSRLPHLNACIALVIDGVDPREAGGTVSLRSGGDERIRLRYPLGAAHFEAFRAACREMARIQFAAGARKVVSLHHDPVELSSPDELDRLDRAAWETLRLRVVTAHQMGGCAMGADPRTSVVDPHLRFHGVENLFVVDGSVLPTALGVNPQLTLFGLGRWAASHVAAAA